MARRVILDTGTLIAIERGKLDFDAVLGADDAAITLSVARIHARLVVEAMSRGKQRSAYDTMITATAVATNRILLTTDGKAEFSPLPGVRSEVIPIH